MYIVNLSTPTYEYTRNEIVKSTSTAVKIKLKNYSIYVLQQMISYTPIEYVNSWQMEIVWR